MARVIYTVSFATHTSAETGSGLTAFVTTNIDTSLGDMWKAKAVYAFARAGAKCRCKRCYSCLIYKAFVDYLYKTDKPAETKGIQ